MLRRLVIAVTIALAAPSLATGQAVKVEFQMGKVTLTATNAPLRAVLTEWSRVGGTRILNPERLTGGPVTLELTAVPERQALDILLRDAGGYMLGPRAALVPGISAYDRLVIVASTGGRPTPVALPVAAPGQQPVRRVAQPIEPPPLPEQADDEIDPDAPSTSAVPRALRPGVAPPPPDGPGPVQTGAPLRGNPFGTTSGAGRPGVVSPAPPSAPPERTPNEQ